MAAQLPQGPCRTENTSCAYAPQLPSRWSQRFQRDGPLQVSPTPLDRLTRWVGGSACAEASHTVWSQTSDTLESGLGNSGASTNSTTRTSLG
jgi:hypothetical protein